jgi:hypothetical protein
MKTIPILFALTLSGCTTAHMKKKHDELHSRYDSPLPPGTEVLEDIPMESNAAVARAADYKAYPVSRYVDPANKEVMHERHVIYRRERPETWRLRPDPDKKILIGPTVGLRNPIALNRPVSQELNAELNRQKIVTRELLKLREHAEMGDARARQLLMTAEKMDRQSDEMLERIRSYNAQLDAVRKDVDDLKRQSRSAPSIHAPEPEGEGKEIPPTGKNEPLITPEVRKGELPKEGSPGGVQSR